MPKRGEPLPSEPSRTPLTATSSPASAGVVARSLTRALRHPAAMAVKRLLRDLGWWIGGEASVKPPIRPGVRSVVFVCLGNICRSPFAARLAAQRATGPPGLRVDSAGLRPTQAARPPADAVLAAVPYGVPLEDHVPAVLTPDLVEAADLIVVMEPTQRDAVTTRFPGASGRVVLLSLFDEEARGYDRMHIEDPFMQGPAAFARCYQRIDRAVSALLAEVRAAG